MYVILLPSQEGRSIGFHAVVENWTPRAVLYRQRLHSLPGALLLIWHVCYGLGP